LTVSAITEKTLKDRKGTKDYNRCLAVETRNGLAGAKGKMHVDEKKVWKGHPLTGNPKDEESG